MAEPTADEILRNQFGPLAGLPSWQVAQGYGSFFTMEFGEPRLEIREPDPESRIAALRRRNVTVKGSRRLGIEQCGWKIMDGVGEVANSESPRSEIGPALRLIDGQILREFRLDPRQGTCRLGFEHRLYLVLRRYEDWKEGDKMLSLSTRETALTLFAGGRLEYEPGGGSRPVSANCGETRIAIGPD